MTRGFSVNGIDGMPEVQEGDDVAALIAEAAPDLQDGDIVVVTSKVVSKAEGRMMQLDRQKAIDSETVRLVAERGDTRIVQTRHGFVLAAAGVDASNVPAGWVALLPDDPDASARALRAGLQSRLGVDVAVIVTDTFGRPWRNGLVDVAIGAAGFPVLDDHRGRTDAQGHTLEMTVTALADEIAAAAELVKGKLDRVPVAVIRGLGHLVTAGAGRASDLVRRPEEDMFRWGSREAVLAALEARARGRGGDACRRSADGADGAARPGAPDDVVEGAVEDSSGGGIVLRTIRAGDGPVTRILGCLPVGVAADPPS